MKMGGSCVCLNKDSELEIIVRTTLLRAKSLNDVATPYVIIEFTIWYHIYANLMPSFRYDGPICMP